MEKRKYLEGVAREIIQGKGRKERRKEGEKTSIWRSRRRIEREIGQKKEEGEEEDMGVGIDEKEKRKE